MQVVNKEEAIVRAMNGDHVYILMPIERMNLKELGERVQAGATFITGDPKVQTPVEVTPIIDNAKVPAPPHPRKGGFKTATYDKDKIMALYDAGWTQKDIADEMGLTLSQVSGAIYRITKKRKKETGKNANKV